MLSVTAPGVHLDRDTEARDLARAVNEYAAEVVKDHPDRFSGLAPLAVDPDRNAEDVLRDLKRFYFDTALSASPSALPALLAFAEPGHVLYGSDWPFAPQEAGSYYNHHLETYPDYTPGQADAINRTNAQALFPRLAD
ncbi:amidohydrolase family protein [Streptomyces sp. NPDC004296]|uniref:amidohydrolase family protein n=1 Tax=Streptomyces sp. NPDC004296 TaxID=3364697 RepID=UPI0036C498B0